MADVEHAVTYEMLTAVISAIAVVGGAWFFIERRIVAVEKEAELQIAAVKAEVALLHNTVSTKYVSVEHLTRLEERIVDELKEMRRWLMSSRLAVRHEDE